ncbi:hypothetical protein GCM10007176_15900 [Salinicoccus roseus]|nr:hypothetical protein GCM10007176_15900 [Salinicoccus roseus]
MACKKATPYTRKAARTLATKGASKASKSKAGRTLANHNNRHH